MVDSIFTKIIKGEIPSNKIYEDDRVYAFLDHSPKMAGHTLVISKKQVAYVWDLSPEDYAAVMNASKKVANRIKQVLQPKFVGMQVEGAAVPHAHVHIFPFNSPEEFSATPDPAHKPTGEELAAMAAKLAF